MSVWQKANKLAVEIFKLSSVLPRSEDYGLTSQVRRSANSVSANIAEAFGRNTPKDKRHFYIIARGSVFETQSHLQYAKDVNYIDTITVQNLDERYSSLIFELNKIIKTLKSQSLS